MSIITCISDRSSRQVRRMGAYKYVSELYRKKQSDVMRYLLRIRYIHSLKFLRGQIFSYLMMTKDKAKSDCESWLAFRSLVVSTNLV